MGFGCTAKYFSLFSLIFGELHAEVEAEVEVEAEAIRYLMSLSISLSFYPKNMIKSWYLDSV